MRMGAASARIAWTSTARVGGRASERARVSRVCANLLCRNGKTLRETALLRVCPAQRLKVKRARLSAHKAINQSLATSAANKLWPRSLQLACLLARLPSRSSALGGRSLAALAQMFARTWPRSLVRLVAQSGQQLSVLVLSFASRTGRALLWLVAKGVNNNNNHKQPERERERERERES